ncbi:MAG: hypothetical protein DWQ31_03735 [Planctomycetota bacterium]|nr:MAG: hypothetical protein DWQ31_03735 [Planctomycetota bacterium]REJ90477.1 MAG: hypothetical protein DWQ35_16290 [Planctomycetota bacterium]
MAAGVSLPSDLARGASSSAAGASKFQQRVKCRTGLAVSVVRKEVGRQRGRSSTRPGRVEAEDCVATGSFR